MAGLRMTRKRRDQDDWRKAQISEGFKMTDRDFLGGYLEHNILIDIFLQSVNITDGNLGSSIEL